MAYLWIVAPRDQEELAVITGACPLSIQRAEVRVGVIMTVTRLRRDLLACTLTTMSGAVASVEPRPIKRLDETLINRIAAGEVRTVKRPSICYTLSV